jgi:hypothetical protein
MISLTDRYAIERELDAGGMATVYLAEDVKHGESCSLERLGRLRIKAGSRCRRRCLTWV